MIEDRFGCGLVTLVAASALIAPVVRAQTTTTSPATTTSTTSTTTTTRRPTTTTTTLPAPLACQETILSSVAYAASSMVRCFNAVKPEKSKKRTRKNRANHDPGGCINETGSPGDGRPTCPTCTRAHRAVAR